MPGKPWTPHEVTRLEWEWGTCTLAEMAERLDRSPDAVREKARLLGLGALGRGNYSLAEVARLTGYDRGRIITAARRAGVNLPRVPAGRKTRKGYKRRHYAIPHEAMERIVEELAGHPDGGRLWRHHAADWGGKFRDGTPKPDACVDCGATRKPHHARGRCRPCHERATGRVALDAPRKVPRDVWAERDPPHCVTCNGTDRPHRAHGECARCYARRWARSRNREELPAIAEDPVC